MKVSLPNSFLSGLSFGLREEAPTQEVSYFVSNCRPTSQREADELFDALRHHWQIEVMHHRRDVTLAEDALRTGNQSINRLMSSLRTLVINLLGRIKPKIWLLNWKTLRINFKH